MIAYYNEHDRFAAQWLRELIKAGHIAPGDVDERSIEDVRPNDVRGYSQCHFFAGIGGWSYALRLAGWPDDRPVWTGSCSCQPFSSAAGSKKHGTESDKHVWPYLRELIASNRPRVVFGEQVANEDEWACIAGNDMEDIHYAFASAIIPACSVGHDHVRSRLFFVCHPNGHSEPGKPIYAEAPRVPRNSGIGGELVSKDGLSSRMAVLRGFGNAIVPQVAAAFIQAYQECLTC